MGCALEEERDRDLEYMGDLLQSAGADAVGSFFVFLHLLESQRQCIAKLLLAHAQHHPTHSDPAADMLVDGVGSFLRHSSDLLILSPHHHLFLCDTSKSGAIGS